MRDITQLKHTRLFLFDMDGTLYLGDNLFPFTRALLEEIRAQGKKYLFFTNNSSKSVDAYVQKLERLGIAAAREDMVTSTQVLIAYLQDNHPGKLFYAMGTDVFCRELEEGGVRITREPSDAVEGIAMGFDTELTFRKLDDVCRLLTEKDIPYAAANPDWVCPTEYGFVPDCGSVAEMIFRATGKRPVFVGKPEPEMAFEGMRRAGIPPEDTLMVGDRLYTDIACGNNAGVKTLLVLSGETDLDMAKASPHKGTYVLKDCGELLKLLQGCAAEEACAYDL